MQIETQQQAAITVLSPKGPLLSCDVAALSDALRKVNKDNRGRVILDLSMTPYTDSKGLELINQLGVEFIDNGQVLKLAGVNETVREVLSLTEVGAVCEQFDDVPSAVRSFS